MRLIAALMMFVMSFFAVQRAAEAAVSIDINLSSQSMHVTSGSGASYTWAISSARSGFSTPRGYYRPQRLEAMHYSRKYHMSPMPHSIFFRGGYAIHGTGAVGQLGRPASHGCIRLAPGHAAQLYAMVKAEGGRIQISGSPPSSTMFASKHLKKHNTAYASAHRGHRSQYAAAAHRQKHRTAIASNSRHHANPLAYAPVAARAPVKSWLSNPAGWAPLR